MISLIRLCFPLLIACAATLASATSFTGKVVSIQDGDTIGIMRDGKEVRVRLDGIDCPEKGQDYGRKAKQFTSSLVFGKSVSVEVRDTDRYGRLVCRVSVDGKDLSLELVKAGLAWHFKKYSKDQMLANAENTARAAKIGLWASPNPTAPWDYRRSHSHSGRK